MSVDAVRRWRAVQVRHLAGFEAIVRAGSFRGAAHDLGYAQAAVSQQLAQLERLVGARLIERAPGTGPIALTPAGRALLEHVGALLSRFEAAREDVTSPRTASIVRVGVGPGIAARALVRATSGLGIACPDLDVRLIDTPTEAPPLELIERGELDLALCEPPPPDGPVDCVAVMEDRFVLLVSAADPVAARGEAPAPAQLARMPFVSLEDPGVRGRLADWLRSRGIEADTRVRCDLSTTVQGVVATGVGIAILPRSCVDLQHPRTTVVELPDAPARTLALCWHRGRGRPRAAELLADTLRAVDPVIGRQAPLSSPLRRPRHAGRHRGRQGHRS
jgi:molybdate transport repressor ModE-like protein